MWIKKRRKQGQWYNRYIDETFNCVPTKFFNNIWHTMEKREGFFIDNQLLLKNPIAHEVRYSILSADNRSYHDYSTGSSSLDLSRFINNIHVHETSCHRNW